MKKRIAAVFCAAVLMLALPTMAFAAGSGSTQSGTAGNVGWTLTGLPAGTAASVSATAATDATLDGAIGVISDSQAKFGPWDIKLMVDGKEVTSGFGSLTISLPVDSAYNGCPVTVYHNHNGVVKQYKGTVSNGAVSVTITELSTFALVVDTSGATVNSGATSPKTGVDTGVVAGASLALLAGAGVVAYALRRKIAE